MTDFGKFEENLFPEVLLLKETEISFQFPNFSLKKMTFRYLATLQIRIVDVEIPKTWSSDSIDKSIKMIIIYYSGIFICTLTVNDSFKQH